MVPTDAELIQKFLNGQNEAFNLLVYRWQAPIYSYLYRQVLHREEAEDLAQQVFITVYNSLRRLKEHAKFKCWLYTIAMNKFRDYRRTRKKNIVFSITTNDKDDDPVHLQTETDAIKNAHKKELEDLIKIALNDVPEEQRHILILKEYQNMTFEEIAQVVGCSINTAKSRMYYGLKKLKQALERLEVNVEDYHENM